MSLRSLEWTFEKFEIKGDYKIRIALVFLDAASWQRPIALWCFDPSSLASWQRPSGGRKS